MGSGFPASWPSHPTEACLQDLRCHAPCSAISFMQVQAHTPPHSLQPLLPLFRLPVIFVKTFKFAVTDTVLWSPVCHFLKHTGEWQLSRRFFSRLCSCNCRFLKSPLTLAVCLQSLRSRSVNHTCLRRDYLRTHALKRRLVFQLILF